MSPRNAISGSASRAASAPFLVRATGQPGQLALDRMPGYTRYVANQIRPFLKGSICQLGSGDGRLTRYLADHEKVTAVEPDGALHLLAWQRLGYQLNIKQVRCPLEKCPNEEVPAGAYDTVIGVHLLEHVKYDITALEIMAELLSDSGHAIVVVPAAPRLYGRLDRTQGRLRRYSRRRLQRAFHEAGLVATRSFTFNVAGLIAWGLLGTLLRKSTVPPACVALADRFIPLMEKAERFTKPPVGLSLLMVGKRA